MRRLELKNKSRHIITNNSTTLSITSTVFVSREDSVLRSFSSITRDEKIDDILRSKIIFHDKALCRTTPKYVRSSETVLKRKACVACLITIWYVRLALRVMWLDLVPSKLMFTKTRTKNGPFYCWYDVSCFGHVSSERKSPIRKSLNSPVILLWSEFIVRHRKKQPRLIVKQIRLWC